MAYLVNLIADDEKDEEVDDNSYTEAADDKIVGNLWLMDLISREQLQRILVFCVDYVVVVVFSQAIIEDLETFT